MQTDDDLLIIVYLSHPYGAATSEQRRANRCKALAWTEWIINHVPRVAVLAPWLYYVEIRHTESEARRRQGLEHDLAMLGGADVVLSVGGMSPGVQAELDHAEKIGIGAVVINGDLPTHEESNDYAQRLRAILLEEMTDEDILQGEGAN